MHCFRLCICGQEKTEWAHALVDGLTVRGAEGSIGQRPIVPAAVSFDRLRNR